MKSHVDGVWRRKEDGTMANREVRLKRGPLCLDLRVMQVRMISFHHRLPIAVAIHRTSRWTWTMMITGMRLQPHAIAIPNPVTFATVVISVTWNLHVLWLLVVSPLRRLDMLLNLFMLHHIPSLHSKLDIPLARLRTTEQIENQGLSMVAETRLPQQQLAELHHPRVTVNQDILPGWGRHHNPNRLHMILEET